MPVTTLTVVENDEDRQSFDTQAAGTALWTARQGGTKDDTTLLRHLLDGLEPAPGDGYVWIAAEARVARALRTHMIETRGHPREWIKAAGYWSREEQGAHKTIQN